MARKGINISVASDTRDFSKGIKSGVIEPLEDAASTLIEIAREGDRTGAKLEDTMKDAQRRTEDLADEHKKLHDVIADGSRKAYRKMEDAADKATREATDVTGEFKDEARSNFSEVTSSFDGSMDSIADLAQGTLGGLAGSLAGPVGIAAGTLAAAGGLFYTQWKENAEKVEARISAMYDDMLESGSEFLTQDYIQQQLRDIYGKTEDAAVGWDKLQEIVRTTGVQESIVALAFAGNADARKQLTDGIIAKQEELAATITNQSSEERTEIGSTIAVMGKWADEMNGLAGEQDSAAARADGYRDAVQRLNTELYQVPEEVRSKVTVTYDDAVARARLDGFISDVERRRITLTIDARLTNHGRSIA